MRILAILLSFLFMTSLSAQDLSGLVVTPLSDYETEEEFNEIVDDLYQKDKKAFAEGKKFQKAQVLTIDTRDQKNCLEIQENFKKTVDDISEDLEHLCVTDFERPYVSLVYSNKVDINPRDYKKFSARERELIRQTRNMTVLGAGVMGALYALPTSVTNWKRDEIGSEGRTYFDNVRNGPVRDSDPWYINYIGHPYAGAVYYRVARHAGYGMLSSFGYSVMMSTLFWEYGMEAIVEIPSIQDLIFTPMLGAVLGELFIYLEKKIKENDGKVLGSKLLGTIAMTLMNPGEFLLRQANKLFENDFIESSNFFLYSGSIPGLDYSEMYSPNMLFDPSYNQIGIGLEIKF